MQVRKHLRKLIKDRITNKTAVADRININPAYIAGNPYPYLEISTPDDNSELISNSIRSTGHSLKVVIDILATAEKEDIYDVLDDIAFDIETLIEQDETFGKAVSEFLLTKTETGKNDEGDATLGFLRMTYECEYEKQKTPKADPDLPILKGFRTEGGPYNAR